MDSFVKGITMQVTSILAEHIRAEVKLVAGVEDELEKLLTTLTSIQAVLVDAEKREIKDQFVKVWVQNLRFASYEIDDALTDWRAEMLKVNDGGSSSKFSQRKVCLAISLPCFSSKEVASRGAIARKIRRINKILDSINTQKDTYHFTLTESTPKDEQIPVLESGTVNETTSFVEPSMICGRENDKSTILRKLVSEGHPQIIFILGMGGVGKSTLAQILYDCDEVKDCFLNHRMWVSVGETFDETRVAKLIVEEAKGSTQEYSQSQTALRGVSNLIEGKKFLLVLDDVWTEDHGGWEQLLAALKGGALGSKILVTTRNEGVVRKIKAVVESIEAMFSVPTVQNRIGTATFTHRLGNLSDDDCWTLFCRFAFSGRGNEFCEDFKVIGRKISDKCKGLPLAAKTIGSLMLSKYTKEEWQHVLNSEIWELEVEESLSRPLLLSYYDLPSQIKRCFCYCANFPKDSKIEADNLIHLWMAQGYLNSGESDEMEIRGRNYLNTLVMRSLFEDLERDKDNQSVLRFKMHDMVHDVARFLVKDECFTGAQDEIERKVVLTPWMNFRHLTITRGEEATFPVPPSKSERLYTFWVRSFHECPQIVSVVDSLPSNFFHHFKYLKALDLSRNRLLELPDEIEKLMNLCYLNLSHNPLYELPASICSLVNLQTLKLVACYHLRELPQSISKLTNLRHLQIDQTTSLETLPKGIGKLISLRTLSKFVIGTEDASCKLGDLKHLNNLRGCLKIEGLGCVADVGEAREASLEKKEHLVDLHINCSSLDRASDILDALQLNKYLQALHMNLCEGQRFPSWMTSLINLKKLQLQKWVNCISLPALGKLPSLEILDIEGIHSLTHVGDEFLGVEIDEAAAAAASSSSLSSSSITAFPKLKKLKFSHMRSWKEWKVIDKVKIMPCLRYLKLSHCQLLQSLPHPVLKLTSLKKLRIHNSVMLRQRYQKVTGEDWEMISHISKIRISGT